MEVYTATEQADENGRTKGKQEAAAVIDGLLLKVERLKQELEGERYRHDLYRDFAVSQSGVLERTKEKLARLEKMVPRYSEIDRIAVMIQCSVGGCSRHWAETIAKYLVANGVCLQSGGEK